MRDPTPGVEHIAAITERLAVLLGAGVTPTAAWQYLADSQAHAAPRGDALIRDVVTAAALAARDGIDVPAAIVGVAPKGPDGHAWRAVAAAWAVAVGTGARLAPCLNQLARSQRALGQAQRDIDAALAGPRSTSRFVTVLPVVGLLFGSVLGFDTLGTLFTTPPGLVCLAAGAMLTILSWRWSNRMVNRALPMTSAPGLEIDLLAIALSSGASVERSQSAVNEALERCELSPTNDRARSAAVDTRVRSEAGALNATTVPVGRAAVRHSSVTRHRHRAGSESTAAAIEDVLALSRSAGIPAADLLRGEAARMRRDARSEAQRAAAALGTRLMIPLGACILPAFMLVGVAPVLLSVLSSTVSGFG
ncbi:type II secretion system F family protein [Mycetocola zhujimingii]|uniref:Pilus assembly protein n=1 Tax=Mycetocola zhujimingii TaxID=2079792 RepID=A0A2U1TF98_9MICO|nr:type II secretion system F family protein [Mycetocola zhujimingii]PWC07546.1 pilus assembly protein [Mycetocola zhujimingii]